MWDSCLGACQVFCVFDVQVSLMSMMSGLDVFAEVGAAAELHLRARNNNVWLLVITKVTHIRAHFLLQT